MRGVNDTIFAVSSPPGRGWRGVIRLSGPSAIDLAASIVRLRDSEDPGQVPSHGVRDGEVLPWPDGPPVAGFLIVMRSPRSYTREDVAEVHTVSSPPVLSAISERLLSLGARLAGPGEFTRRAFLNGRIDLSRAEAVIRVIEAEDAGDLRLAQRKLRGSLSARIDQLKGRLSHLLAQVEAGIDFCDQGIEIISDDQVARRIGSLREGVEEILGPDGDRAGSIRDAQVDVCLAGLPNVGKSSLFNCLVGARAAMVSPEEGTTRDYLRATIEEDGIRFRLTDPAGIRRGRDVVEEEAVRRARTLLEGADVVVVVLDGSREMTPKDLEIVDLVRERPSLLAVNKADLPSRASAEGLLPAGRTVVTSARTSEGIDRLRTALVRMTRSGDGGGPGAEYLLAARERGLLRLAKGRLDSAARVQDPGGMDRLAADLRDALQSLGELTGEVTTDETLEQIFSRFCIGK